MESPRGVAIATRRRRVWRRTRHGRGRTAEDVCLIDYLLRKTSGGGDRPVPKPHAKPYHGRITTTV